MKKRTARILLFALALCLMFSTALAEETWQEYAKSILVKQQTIGKYSTWPFADKQQFLETLADEGFLRTDERVLSKIAEETEERAEPMVDQLIAQWVGVPVEEVNFMDIMEAANGAPFTLWTHEQRAWYSQAEQDAGINLSDKTVYGVPRSEDIDETQAIAIASDALAGALQLDEEALQSCEIYCDYQEKTEDGMQNQWHVEFVAGKDADVPFSSRWIFVDAATGDVNTAL